MSDGNFNRNLLPYNNYQSGFKAGQAIMKQRAVSLFQAYLQSLHPALSGEEVERLCNEFRQKLQ